MAPKGFKISATGLNRFWKCPRSYVLGLEMEPVSKSPAAKRGILLHQAMAGEKVVLEDPIDVEAVVSIKAMEESFGYEADQREYRDYIFLDPEIIGVRVLDFIGRQQGVPVVVDYKFPTDTWVWRDRIVPQSQGFQSAMYLFPPDSNDGTWPERLDYLVATKDKSYLYIYNRDEDKEEQLIQAAKLVKQAHKVGFPKVETKSCKWCDFFDACHTTSDWEDKYVSRREEKHE